MQFKLKNNTLLKILLSFTLLAILAWFVNPVQVLDSIVGAHKIWLISALAMAISNRILMAVKWNILARSIRVSIPWGVAISAYFASTFAGIFLPPTIGADSVRTYILSSKYSHAAEIISSILIERIIGLVVIAGFGLVGMVILLHVYSSIVPGIDKLTWFIGGSAVFLFTVTGFTITPAFGRFVKYLIGVLENHGDRMKRYAGMMRKIQLACVGYKGQKIAVFIFLIMTIFENLLVVIRAWMVTLAFGADVGILLFFVIVPIEQFLIRLPISFDGFGIREGIFLYALTAMGVPAATAFAIGLTNHLLFIISVTPGAWFLSSFTDTKILARNMEKESQPPS